MFWCASQNAYQNYSFQKKKQSKKQQGKNENITISFHSEKIKIKTHIYIQQILNNPIIPQKKIKNYTPF